MKNTAHTPKKLFKSLLQQLGLYAYVLRIKRRKYQSIKMFAVTINGVKVQFSTENEYSNSWFFPRYAGGKIHEKIVTDMLIKVLDGAKCFVDIGANLGWYTCLACKHMPQGIVYGFEMDDLNFAFLQKNIAINSCTNVEVHNLAISDSSGVLSYKRESNRPSPLFRLTSGDTDKNSAGLVSVSSITLDDFFKSKELMPDVIKIDVEGAEMNVLRGMRRITREFKPTLFLEVHPDNLPSFNTSSSAILSLLIDNGYKVFEIEEMRGHKSSEQLKALSQGSVLERNTMLYAVAAK
jgi:FkbM family methyltransferase